MLKFPALLISSLIAITSTTMLRAQDAECEQCRKRGGHCYRDGDKFNCLPTFKVNPDGTFTINNSQFTKNALIEALKQVEQKGESAP